jgi:hypothetical protein
MQPYGGVGGLHQVVSKLRLNLFADNRQKEKGGKLVSFVVSNNFQFLFVGNTMKIMPPKRRKENAEMEEEIR